jgi:hypothetical protein
MKFVLARTRKAAQLSPCGEKKAADLPGVSILARTSLELRQAGLPAQGDRVARLPTEPKGSAVAFERSAGHKARTHYGGASAVEWPEKKTGGTTLPIFIPI